MTVAAFFAVLGHLFPVWLKFRGGKGLATSLGAFILLTPKSICVWWCCFCSSRLRFVTCRLHRRCGGGLFAAGMGLARVQGLAATAFDAAVSALVMEASPEIGRIATGTESKLGRKPHTNPER